MPVPTIASDAYSFNTTGSNNFTFDLPATITAGDLLVAIIHTISTPASLDVSGWTLLHKENYNVGQFSVWLKDADGLEGATKQTSVTSPGGWGVYVMAMQGAADSTSVNHSANAETLGTGLTSFTHSAVTIPTSDCFFMRCHSRSGGNAPVWPTGWSTTHVEILSQSLYHQYRQPDTPVAAGDTGTVTITGLSGSRNHGATTLVIAPDAAVAPTISSVTLTGTSQIGQTLTATVVTDQDPVDSTTYQWQKAATDDAEPGTDISGETSSTLALTYADFGDLLDTAAYVRCQAIATKNSLASDEVASAWQAVTVPSGSGGGAGSLIGSPLII